MVNQRIYELISYLQPNPVPFVALVIYLLWFYVNENAYLILLFKLILYTDDKLFDLSFITHIYIRYIGIYYYYHLYCFEQLITTSPFLLFFMFAYLQHLLLILYHF